VSTDSIPTFFIPGIAEDKAEGVFEQVIEQSQQLGTNPTGAKVFRLYFTHDGKDLVAEVGKPHPHYPNVPGSEVKLIVEQRSPRLYKVEALPSPFLVGHTDTQHVVHFSE